MRLSPTGTGALHELRLPSDAAAKLPVSASGWEKESAA